MLEVNYITPIRDSAKNLSVRLTGCGYVPEVELTYPQFDANLDAYNIVFNALLIGRRSNKKIQFKNVGEISCKVILEICDDIEGVFSLVPKKDTIKMLNYWDGERKIHRLLTMFLPFEKRIDFRKSFFL